MVGTWCYIFLCTLGFMVSGLLVFICIAFAILILPIALGRTFFVSRERRRFLEEIGLSHLQGDSRPILIQLNTKNNSTLSLYFKIQNFLVFYTRFDFVIFGGKILPSWLEERIANEDSMETADAKAFLTFALSLNKIFTEPSLKSKEQNLPQLVALVHSAQLHHWLKFDSASQNFNQKSIIAISQEAIRPALPKITAYILPKNSQLSHDMNEEMLLQIIKRYCSLADVRRMNFKKSVFQAFNKL